MRKYLTTTIALSILFCSSYVFTSAQAPDIEWQRTLGGSLYDRTHCIIQTSDGGYLVGGGSASNISGEKSANSLGGWDYWLLKLNAAGTIEWQNTIGGSGDDFLQSFQQTNDGGYILAGYSPSNISGNKTENSKGGIDYWVVKLNSAGTIVWQKTIGGSGTDELNVILQTSDGGYLLGGYSTSDISGDKNENSKGAEDYWIVKINSTGAIVWQHTIGGSGEDELYSMDNTSDGGFILGGYSASGISGDKTENSKGGDDYWVVKIDSLGIIKWQKTIGGSGDDDLYSIRQTASGGYILGGHSQSNISGDKNENSLGGWDFWIVKLSPIGIINWQNTIGASSDDYLYSLRTTLDGGTIAGGFSFSDSSGDKTEHTRGGSDYWMIKISTTGAIQWQKTIGGSLYEDNYGEAIQTKGGGYIIAGYSTSNISGEKSENARGFNDYWVVKLCASTCEPPANPMISNLTSTSVKVKWTVRDCAHGYVVQYRPTGTQTWINQNVTTNTGFKNISGLTPNTTYQWRVKTKCDSNPNQYSDATAIKTFTTPLRLAQQSSEEYSGVDEIKIYPNPVTSVLTISFVLEQSENISVKIFDLNGRLVSTLSNNFFEEGEHQLPWNVKDEKGNSVNPGIYLMQIQTATFLEIEKLVVEK